MNYTKQMTIAHIAFGLQPLGGKAHLFGTWLQE
jgi:hypothetical protein